MLRTATIEQIAVNKAEVYAFRITGQVEPEDLKQMGAVMNDAFEIHKSVSMILVFDAFDGVEAGAGFDMETVRSQFRSVAKVDKYAVVGAPTAAATMIKIMDKILPTDARIYASSDEPAAWAFIGAEPVV